MKLLELLPNIELYKRIKRESWNYCLIKSEYTSYPLIKIDMCHLQIEKYALTYDDLIADDWEIVN